MPKRPGARWVERLRIGQDGPYAAHLEAGARGVVVVAVGGGHGAQKLSGPLLPRVGGQNGDHLQLGVKGDAGDLLLYEDGVFDPVACLLPPPPAPAAGGHSQGRPDTQERRLP